MNTPEPLFTGKNKIYFAEMESTNGFAMELISKTNPIEGSCIITDFQTSGKGQIGRYWFSDAAKNILISYIFYPKSLNIKDQFYLNIISGLAVKDVVTKYCNEVKIKWPNDIYVGKNKIAGILVQNVLRGADIKATVIGIGLNVNQDIFPNSIPNPTSMFLESDTSFDLPELITLLSARLEFQYLKLQSGKMNFLKLEYLSHLYRMKEVSSFSDENGVQFDGEISGIDHQGKLIIQKSDGQISNFGFREISYII